MNAEYGDSFSEDKKNEKLGFNELRIEKKLSTDVNLKLSLTVLKFLKFFS